jgi:hypothetical protein
MEPAAGDEGMTVTVTVVLPWCYSGVTVVLQWCYSGVTVVLQWCYSGVTVVLQWCNSGVTVVLQWCYSGVTAVGSVVPSMEPAAGDEGMTTILDDIMNIRTVTL